MVRNSSVVELERTRGPETGRKGFEEITLTHEHYEMVFDKYTKKRIILCNEQGYRPLRITALVHEEGLSGSSRRVTKFFVTRRQAPYLDFLGAAVAHWYKYLIL